MNIVRALKLASVGGAAFFVYRSRGATNKESAVFAAANPAVGIGVGSLIGRIPAVASMSTAGILGVSVAAGIPVVFALDYTFEHRKTVKDKIQASAAKIKKFWNDLDGTKKRKIKVAGGVVLAAGAAFVAGAFVEKKIVTSQLPEVAQAVYDKGYGEGQSHGVVDGLYMMSMNMPMDKYFLDGDGNMLPVHDDIPFSVGRLMIDSGYTAQGRVDDMSPSPEFLSLVDKFKNSWINASDDLKGVSEHLRGLIPDWKGAHFQLVSNPTPEMMVKAEENSIMLQDGDI